ncbi:glycoside hydrolase family 13 protein [Ideonella sp.]|uniref:glycoside hydrolase family 13 protein n=1 Tax=Ideonella sp. TaxID=1929293 RepID=UPI0035B140F1
MHDPAPRPVAGCTAAPPPAHTPAATPAPFGDTVLYLRGSMNNWGALDEHAFQFHCDAYYLNVRLAGRHEFKIADAAWTPSLTSPAQTLAFDGSEQTLRAVIVADRVLLSLGPKAFDDPATRPVVHPVAASLRFDSRSAAHKRPFGAVTEGSAIDFTVTALPGVQRLTLVVERRRLEGNQERLDYEPVARVPMRRQPAPTPGGHERWTARHTFGDKAIYGYWFEAWVAGPDGPDAPAGGPPQRVLLQNNAESVFWTRERGTHGAGVVGHPPSRDSAIRRFRQTVYDPKFEVPAYAADLVYYYVFPERFRNGDRENDPRPGGGRPQDRYQDHPVERHARWTEAPCKPGTGDGSDAVYNNDFFGGDLAGLIDKLDDIRELGANALYLTPIFQAASNHKYDTADYHRIDPAFGSNADFERLTREAARRGMRVVIDASFNHVGSDSVYFNRHGRFGSDGAFQGGRVNPASPYASWFRLDPTQTDPDRQYRGWVGVADLPELDKSSRAWRDFAYGRPDAVTRVWLDRGAAGWRMDVAPWVPDDFWREWRQAVKAHRPDAITVAETWFDAAKYFLGDTFDSTMNYIFRNTVLAMAGGGDAALLYRNLELLREAYPPPAFHALMNLLSTHDQARSLHVLGWTDGAPPAAVAQARRRYRLALLWQMTYPGAPAIYYGDEVGVTGGDDPFNRATYPWPDEGGQPDLALRAEVQRLVQLRHREPVLRRGSLDAPLFADAQAIVLARRLGHRWALTAFNHADTPRELTLALPDGAPAGPWADALAPDAPVHAAARDRTLTLRLPALGGQVLLAGDGPTP